ncbi:MAG TPA: DUF192 domain-containing protein [Steroidobacteraceae bacterium]|nr:DUF192 domain-containing protein [Steroidobacteraceae bacterium]
MKACIAGRAATALVAVLTAAGAANLVHAQPNERSRQIAPLDQFPRDPLTIVTARGVHSFNVWIADTEARRTQGLMFVRTLRDDMGMLFTYGSPRPIALGMKNTLIPLDILFVRADGRISRILANVTPESLTRLESGESVLAGLELKGGTADRLGISPGARVIHPLFARP